MPVYSNNLSGGKQERGRRGEEGGGREERALPCLFPSYKGISSVELGSHPSDLYHCFTGPVRHVGD